MSIILTKKSDTASSVPLAADLTNAAGGAELAVNTADKRLYSKTSGGTVVELGTNPSTMSLPNGTANGVPYLNASKVLTSGSALTFDGTTLTSATYIKTGGGAASNTSRLMVNTANGTAAGIQLFQDGVESWIMGMPASSGALTWSASGSEQMRLTSGNLGIGTSSPGTVLHVQRSSANAVFRLSSSGGSGRDWDINSQTDGHLTIGSDLISGQLDLYAGNLGLGVTPSAWIAVGRALEIGAVGTGIWGRGNISDYVTNTYFSSTGYKYANTAGAGRYTVNENVHSWHTAPTGTAGNAISFTQAMTLDASGNHLLGTTSKTGFQSGIVGQVDAGGTGVYARQLIGHSNGTGSGEAYAQYLYNATVIGSITQNGTTGVLYNMVSDHRLKTVIGSVTDSGTRIDALEPIEYEWKSDGSRTRGFLAHKFQEVYAGSVTGTKDAVDKEGKPVYQAMQAGSSEVIADLVAEIQSLRKRLAAAGI